MAAALVALRVALAPMPQVRGKVAQPPPIPPTVAVTEGAGKAPFQVVDVAAIKALLQKSRGHIVLLHFWASWCYPCLKELPLIDRFAREMRPRGLDVLSLSRDLKDQTAGVECRKDSGVIDEAKAYKNIDSAMKQPQDLVEIVAELRQIVCVKG